MQARHVVMAADHAIDVALARKINQATLMPSPKMKGGVHRSEGAVDLSTPGGRTMFLARHGGCAEQASETFEISADPRQKMATDEGTILMMAVNHQISPPVGRDMNNLIASFNRQASSIRDEGRLRIMISDEINELGSFRMPSAKVLDHGVAGRGTSQRERNAGVEDVADKHVGIGPVLLKEAKNQIGSGANRTKMQVGEKKAAVATDGCLLGGGIGQDSLLQFLHLLHGQKIG